MRFNPNLHNSTNKTPSNRSTHDTAPPSTHFLFENEHIKQVLQPVETEYRNQPDGTHSHTSNREKFLCLCMGILRMNAEETEQFFSKMVDKMMELETYILKTQVTDITFLLSEQNNIEELKKILTETSRHTDVKNKSFFLNKLNATIKTAHESAKRDNRATTQASAASKCTQISQENLQKKIYSMLELDENKNIFEDNKPLHNHILDSLYVYSKHSNKATPNKEHRKKVKEYTNSRSEECKQLNRSNVWVQIAFSIIITNPKFKEYITNELIKLNKTDLFESNLSQILNTVLYKIYPTDEKKNKDRHIDQFNGKSNPLSRYFNDQIPFNKNISELEKKLKTYISKTNSILIAENVAKLAQRAATTAATTAATIAANQLAEKAAESATKTQLKLAKIAQGMAKTIAKRAGDNAHTKAEDAVAMANDAYKKAKAARKKAMDIAKKASSHASKSSATAKFYKVQSFIINDINQFRALMKDFSNSFRHRASQATKLFKLNQTNDSKSNNTCNTITLPTSCQCNTSRRQNHDFNEPPSPRSSQSYPMPIMRDLPHHIPSRYNKKVTESKLVKIENKLVEIKTKQLNINAKRSRLETLEKQFNANTVQLFEKLQNKLQIYNSIYKLQLKDQNSLNNIPHRINLNGLYDKLSKIDQSITSLKQCLHNISEEIHLLDSPPLDQNKGKSLPDLNLPEQKLNLLASLPYIKTNPETQYLINDTTSTINTIKHRLSNTDKKLKSNIYNLNVEKVLKSIDVKTSHE